MNDRRRRLLRPIPIDVGPNTYRGQFGFRNRENRTGVDPWDTEMEAARTEGLLLKGLLTGRLQTRNPVALAMMLIGALALLFPLFATAVEIASGGRISLVSTDYYGGRIFWGLTGMTICFHLACFVLPGVLLLYNFVSSLFQLSTPEEPEKKKKPETDHSSGK